MINKRVFFLATRILVAILLVLVLLLTGRLNFSLFSGMNFLPLVFAFPLYLLVFLAGIYRWWLLVKTIELPLSFWDTIRLAMSGNWVSSVVPGGSIFAGDAARTAIFAFENKRHRIAALTSVIADRMLGMLAIFTFAAMGLLINPTLLLQSRWLKLIGLMLVSLIFLILFIIFLAISKKTHDFLLSVTLLRKIPGNKILYKVLDAFYLYKNNKKTLIKAHLVSYIGHGSMILAIFCLSQGLGIKLSTIPDYLFAISIGIISAMIPISGPAGVGTGNVGFCLSFSLVNSNYGAELALLWQMSFIIASQLGLLFFLMGRRKADFSRPFRVSPSKEDASALKSEI